MTRTTAIALVLLAAAACGKKKDTAPAVQTATATRQDIVVDVEATGVITPINPVQVKSKASGTVLKIYVETGKRVKRGDLLVKIDPRMPQNTYDQAAAAVKAAEASVAVTKTALDRSTALMNEGMLTAPELETAQLNYANAVSQQVAARTALDNASIALEDVTIRAPMAGIIIEKDVSEGQVIASATGNVSGGTTLLQMADLSQVMDSTLVGESDIGNVKAGLSATVKVDAYPTRVFHGTVEKISPEATVQQSVTMFPVFIRLDNADGALMPGMNSDVAVLVEQRDNVLAIPNDAVRGVKDLRAAATALGLDFASVQQQMGGGAGGRGGMGNGAPPSVSVTSGQCDSVQKVIDKDPTAKAKMQALRQQMQAPNADRQALFQQMRAVYDSLHIDAGVARACAQLRRASAGGTQLSAGGTTDEEGAQFGNTRPRPGLVFVQSGTTFVPRMLTLGVGNYDVTQVLSGLQEGEKVAMINAAILQAQRTQRQQQIQSRVGLPGVSQQGNQNAAQGNRQGGGQGQAGQGQGGQGRGQGGQAAQAPPPPPPPPPSGSRPPGAP